jgi:uncharacterized protein
MQQVARHFPALREGWLAADLWYATMRRTAIPPAKRRVPIKKRRHNMVDKVVATPAALELVAFLKTKHGPDLMFHQSGGCCDNSAANCYLPGEITMGAGDVYLGDVGGSPFYIGRGQYEYWKHTQLIIDVIEGHGGTFSLEGPEGKAFHTRSRVFTQEELAELAAEEALQQSGKG